MLFILRVVHILNHTENAVLNKFYHIRVTLLGATHGKKMHKTGANIKEVPLQMLLRKYLEVHGRYKPCQSMRTSPQSVVISAQTDTSVNVHQIKWQALLIAAISVSEVRSEGEPAEKVDEGPGKSR